MCDKNNDIDIQASYKNKELVLNEVNTPMPLVIGVIVSEEDTSVAYTVYWLCACVCVCVEGRRWWRGGYRVRPDK